MRDGFCIDFPCARGSWLTFRSSSSRFRARSSHDLDLNLAAQTTEVRNPIVKDSILHQENEPNAHRYTHSGRCYVYLSRRRGMPQAGARCGSRNLRSPSRHSSERNRWKPTIAWLPLGRAAGGADILNSPDTLRNAIRGVASRGGLQGRFSGIARYAPFVGSD